MAAAQPGKGKKLHGRRFLCGVPKDHCLGALTATHLGQGSVKLHGSSLAAFNCYRRYLIDVEGYTQIGPREFAAPNGGPIRVLTKKSRFGCMCRPGKENRWMFPQHGIGAGITSA